MKKNFQRIPGRKLNILHQLWATVSELTTLQNRRILNKNCAKKYSPFHMSEMFAHTYGLWTVFRATYFVQILSGGTVDAILIFFMILVLDPLFLTLYKELCFRHIYSKLKVKLLYFRLCMKLH